MDDFKQCDTCGPGGWKCYCCAPKPGKDRAKARRLMRRRLKRKTQKEIKEELKEQKE